MSMGREGLGQDSNGLVGEGQGHQARHYGTPKGDDKPRATHGYTLPTSTMSLPPADQVEVVVADMTELRGAEARARAKAVVSIRSSRQRTVQGVDISSSTGREHRRMQVAWVRRPRHAPHLALELKALPVRSTLMK